MGEDERKKIAELYFGTDKAEKGLIRIEERFKNLTKISENYIKIMQKGFGNSSFLNSKDISKIGNLTDAQLKKINAQQIKSNTKMAENAFKTQNEISVITTREAEKRATAEIKANLKVQKSATSMYDKIADYAKTYLIYQGFNELRQSARELVDEMVNVEYQMVQIDRVLNDSSININNYRDELIQLAYDYGNSFENVADITLRLAQAGFDAQESLALTEKTLLALNTAELNATQATDDMVAIMAQWGLMTGTATEQAEAYSEIIDKINITADNFPITSADIMEAMKKTSSAFKLAGMDIDETISIIVSAEKASQRGGKAIGTALSNISQQLKATSRIDIAKDLGIDFFKDENKTEYKDLIDILGELSEKMEELKASGKESSVEMQNLLEVFTVFRRNIGASLLGEMSGENSTYQQVMDILGDPETIGYSMRENAKHMGTAKAALKQFNATLLQLKTTVWDAGAEDMFRSLLVLGTDLAEALKVLFDTFGTGPTVITLAVTAFSTLNKSMQLSNLTELIPKIQTYNALLKNAGKDTEEFAALTQGTSKSFKEYLVQVGKGEASLKGYGKYLVSTRIKTALLTAGTALLQAALSFGLSIAIQGVIKLVDKLIVTEQERIEQTEEAIRLNNEEIDSAHEKINTIDELISKYEELGNIEPSVLSKDEQKELERYQQNITDYLIEQNEYTAEMVGNYDLQLKRLKEIRLEQQRIAVENARNNLGEQTSLQTGIGYTTDKLSGLDKLVDVSRFYKEMSEAGNLIVPGSFAGFNTLDINTQYELLKDFKQQLETTGQSGTEAWTNVKELLEIIEQQTKGVKTAQDEYNQELAKMEIMEIVNSGTVKTVEDYKKQLDEISKMNPPRGWNGNVSDFRAILQELLSKEFPEFQKQLDVTEGTFSGIDTILSSFTSKMESLQTGYTTLTSAQQELNESGKISVETFNQLVDNDLLQYLDVINGKLKINKTEFNEAANETKEKVKADLQAQAAAQILSIVQDDLNNKLSETQSPAQTATNSIEKAGDAALEAAKKAVIGATSFDMFNKAMEGQGISYVGISENAKKEIDNVLSQLDTVTKTIDNVTLKTSKGATKTFKEQSQERIKIFKQEIDEYESLEKAWVNKYKKLELFGTSDLKFITHQRINRYNDYLNQIKNLTGISEEDRTDLLREYTSKRQELELEYFDLLKDQLEDQIDALEKANDEKIKLIEEQADAQIEALKKVEAENDRIKEKEEYERKRNELLYGHQGIEYWRQRQGAEAQRALLEAEQELAELDKDWEEKKKDWTLEDQIEEIENARDAQIEAIEKAQEVQIQAWRDAYQAQVNLYAETGQIIYDNSVINAGYLYEAYMSNFVNPLNVKLREISSAINSANQAANQAASKVGVPGTSITTTTTTKTTVDKSNVLQSNPINNTSSSSSAYNKLSDTQLPLRKLLGKFHGGGLVNTAAEEALAIVRKNEVVLRPEWAAGLDKLVQQINNGGSLNNTSNNTNVNVYGNLANFDAIKVNERKDVANIEKLITQVLKDKFNINK